jgi:pimeloyl-ACP methyl ester carboxylesterase
VLGLISVDGAVNLDEGAAYLSALLNFGPFRRIGELFLTRYGTEARVGQILRSAYYHQDLVTAEVVDGYYNRLVTGRWAQSLLAMARDMPRNTITFPLEDIAFPTLILWGENDTWVKRTDIDRWRGKIPAVEFHAIPEAGHLLMEEKPELFNNMVLAFIESHENDIPGP